MTIPVFDTSILIDIDRADPKTLRELEAIRQRHPERPRISHATYTEYFYGWLRRGKEPREITSHLEEYETIETTATTNQESARIRLALEDAGRMVSASDVFIAASTLSVGGILITRDKHFTRIAGLQVILLE